TFIVSGGGIEFMRPWTEKIYGIPPEKVVGSSIKTKFELRDGNPVLIRDKVEIPQVSLKITSSRYHIWKRKKKIVEHVINS
ncbi:MAG: hypothetical protein P8Z79_24290, partial [Sedimentisphaerales bacterium]